MNLLIADQSIRVIDLEGQMIRELTLDPAANCQPIAPTETARDHPRHVSGIS